MFITYSITTTQTESKQICSKLIELLEKNDYLPKFDEPFPINSKCIALYTVDSLVKIKY